MWALSGSRYQSILVLNKVDIYYNHHVEVLGFNLWMNRLRQSVKNQVKRQLRSYTG